MTICVDGIFHNWEASLYHGKSEESKLLSWAPPYTRAEVKWRWSWLRKSWLEGVGRVLSNRQGVVLVMFSTGVFVQ